MHWCNCFVCIWQWIKPRRVNVVTHVNLFIQFFLLMKFLASYIYWKPFIYMEMSWLWQMEFILLIRGLYMSNVTIHEIYLDQSLYSIRRMSSNQLQNPINMTSSDQENVMWTRPDSSIVKYVTIFMNQTRQLHCKICHDIHEPDQTAPL